MNPTTRWVKVEFWGRLPDGLAVEEVNVAEVANTLGKAFGFTHVDRVSVTAREEP